MLETFESHAGGLVMKDADGIAGIDLEIAPKLRTHHRSTNRHEQSKVVGPILHLLGRALPACRRR
jgi:hypothetical protein